MVIELRDEFNDFFSDVGGVAQEDFIENFKYGSFINMVRKRVQSEAESFSTALAGKGIKHTVYFDLVASPELNAGAATPRDGLSFIAINLGTLLKSRIIIEILMSQIHNPDEEVVKRELLLSLIRDNMDPATQWEFLRALDQLNFIVNDAFPESFVLFQWAIAFDYVYCHELNHIMLGHTEYADKNLRLDRLNRGSFVSEAEAQKKLQLLELRADYGSGIILGNCIPNKKTVVFPPPTLELTLKEFMANTASALTAILSAFNIRWEQENYVKLFHTGSHPHSDFRFRAISDGIISSLRKVEKEHADTWLRDAGYLGNAYCKRAYTKILGVEHERDLQPGPIIHIPKTDRLGPHPHRFGRDAEMIYTNLFESMRHIDAETDVKAYLG